MRLSFNSYLLSCYCVIKLLLPANVRSTSSLLRKFVDFFIKLQTCQVMLSFDIGQIKMLFIKLRKNQCRTRRTSNKHFPSFPDSRVFQSIKNLQLRQHACLYQKPPIIILLLAIERSPLPRTISKRPGRL